MWIARTIFHVYSKEHFTSASAAGRGVVLVDIPMDHFSSNLFVDAFDKVPPFMAKPSLDPGTAQRIVETLAQAKHPVLYAVAA